MNEQELRIGNWVFDDNETPMKVVRIDESRYGEWNGNNWGLSSIMLQRTNRIGDYWESEVVSPIPIDNPILIKHHTEYFFDYSNNEASQINYKVSENVRLRLTKGRSSVIYWQPILIDVEGNEIKLPLIEHLHQLQNLVFALSSKELEINL